MSKHHGIAGVIKLMLLHYKERSNSFNVQLALASIFTTYRIGMKSTEREQSAIFLP